MDRDVKDIIYDLERVKNAIDDIEIYADSIDDVIESLENNVKIVHCCECKNRDTKYCPVYATKPYLDNDWYCGDGEKW